jgi:hypothetical protein
MNYREEPTHDWEMDTRSFYYSGMDSEWPYSHMVRSLKENICLFALITKPGSRLEVFAEGDRACRFNRMDEKNCLIIDTLWDYPNLMWGNYMKELKLPEELRSSAILKVN